MSLQDDHGLFRKGGGILKIEEQRVGHEENSRVLGAALDGPGLVAGGLAFRRGWQGFLVWGNSSQIKGEDEGWFST